MTAVAQRLHLRGFLEGVEVPIVSISIQSGKNAAAVCSVQIVANDYALDLLPRTLVHIFEYDGYHGAPPAELVSVGGYAGYNEPGTRVEPARDDNAVDPELGSFLPPERFETTSEQTTEDLLNENYKLAFGGEVVGFSIQKTPTGRVVVLQCVDWSSYWDIAYQYMVSGMSLGGGGIRGAFTGAATTVFNDFLDGSADIVTRLIDSPPRSYPSLAGTLLGGVTHLIESIGGVYYGSRAIRGVNDFFSLAEIRLHITQMLGANPYGTRDEARLLRAHGFASLFRRSLAGLGRLVTIRQVLLALQRYIFHEIIPITSPRYIPPMTDPNLPAVERVSLENDTTTRPIWNAARQIKARCEELKQRLSRCEDFDDARRESDRRGGLRTEIGRIKRVCAVAATNARRAHTTIGGDGRLAGFFGLPEVDQAFTAAGERFDGLLFATRRGQSFTVLTPTFPLYTDYEAASIEANLNATINSMQTVMDTQFRRRAHRRTSQPDPPPRLITQVYRPDVWMVAPPRCNVIFPEMYSQFSYGRNYMQETTRMLLRTHSAFFGSDILFDGFYMAPSNILGQRTDGRVIRGRGGADPPETSDAPIWVRRDLLNHELYTGIIPTFERMSDLNLHALRNGSVEIATESGMVRVGYAQLACNHIFFQYRFRSRQLQLSGKNNPYSVLGFPMLVIDKYLPIDHLRDGEYEAAVAARFADAIREGDGEVGTPEERAEIYEADSARVNSIIADIAAQRPNTHFLGTPASISRTVDASSGGSTQIQMEYARTTNERTEFFGDNVGRTGRARRTRNQRVTSVVGALDAPVVGNIGPRGGNILEVTDVTDQYTRRTRSTTRTATGSARHSSTTRVPLFVPNRRATGRTRGGTQVIVGVTQAAESYGPEVVALVGSGGTVDASTGDVTLSFSAWRVVEDIGVYIRENVELPPEDITFPPWYGESWRTNRVGALYAYLFGTGAITDPTVFLDPRGIEAARSGDNTEGADRSLEVRLAEAFAGTSARMGPTGDAATPPPPGHSSTLDLSPGEEAGEAAPPDPPVAAATVRARSPIAEATEEIVRAYSLVKINNFDVHNFLKAYGWRPIASMVDMFGTSNLEIANDGEVVRGREGFHSRAFGDYDDLRQLVGPGDGTRPQTILGLTTRDADEVGEARTERDDAISQRLDTRKEKRVAVLRYVNALGAACGVLG